MLYVRLDKHHFAWVGGEIKVDFAKFLFFLSVLFYDLPAISRDKSCDPHSEAGFEE